MTDATPAVRIRSARESDLPVLRSIQHRTLAEPAPDVLTAIVGGAGLALVAVRAQPVGYVLALTPGKLAYVPELAVVPAHQRNGIGTQLLERVVQRAGADGARQLRVTVHADDESARRFYRDRGFDIEKRLPEQFDAGSGVGLLLVRDCG
ncbi:N-acetyltransferase [Halorhabdus sp. CBA1104]|uniref:GNAT family N-acetyltransferase n=1 Tax=Halorhabdus sp. CBA1104 TaxID=1380432 RepID=UPI0012B25574|nr:N-acetyltransferase [Halorhabdus sp. CBA1104]QGN07647.1 N-acetyltransferase [Halorhabdus sp. CBA1104]